MTSLDPTRWPLDFERLERGRVLSVEDVERATLTERNDERAFDLARLQLRGQIINYFRDFKHDCVTVVNDGLGLRILNHQEQAAYAPQRESKAIRQIRLAAAEGAAVDLKQLTDEQRDRHERWMAKNSWRMAQLSKRPNPQLGNGGE